MIILAARFSKHNFLLLVAFETIGDIDLTIRVKPYKLV